MEERIIALIGPLNYEKIRNKHVLIVGLGGVGAIASESLVRSGIENFTLIDGDIYEKTNLNRQIFATYDTLGKSKVEVAKKRLESINPNAKIKAIQLYLNNENKEILENFDYIIDACDTIATKVLLIKFALEHNIKIISSMGMGKRLNPLDLTICSLAKTYNDPLAKVMRQKLKENKLSLNIPVVFSKELPLNNNNNNNMITSMAFVPNTAGLMMAYFVINDLIKIDNSSNI